MAAVRKTLCVILQTLQDTSFPGLYGRTQPLNLVQTGEFISFRVFPSNDALAGNLPADRRQLA
jgi:hypothetical protein